MEYKKLTDDRPIKLKIYYFPLHYENSVKKKMVELLRLDISESLNTPFSP